MLFPVKIKIYLIYKNVDFALFIRNCFKQKCAEKKAEYQAMKLDDLISSVND